MKLSKVRAAIQPAITSELKVRRGARYDLVENKDGRFVALGIQESELVLAPYGKRKESKILKSAQRLELIKKTLFGVGVMDIFRR